MMKNSKLKFMNQNHLFIMVYSEMNLLHFLRVEVCLPNSCRHQVFYGYHKHLEFHNAIITWLSENITQILIVIHI